MPMFTRAEMNMHISKSGKSLDSQSKAHSVPTSMRKANTFLDDEYLKDISAAGNKVHFFFKCLCYHRFRKNDPPVEVEVGAKSSFWLLKPYTGSADEIMQS